MAVCRRNIQTHTHTHTLSPSLIVKLVNPSKTVEPNHHTRVSILPVELFPLITHTFHSSNILHTDFPDPHDIRSDTDTFKQ